MALAFRADMLADPTRKELALAELHAEAERLRSWLYPWPLSLLPPQRRLRLRIASLEATIEALAQAS